MLAISDDGKYLYTVLLGARQIQRVDLETRQTNLTFAIGNGPFFGPYSAEDIVVMPDQPETILVSRTNPGLSPRHAGVAVYDNGMPRPNSTQDHTGSNRIEPSASPDRLFGLLQLVSEG